VEQEVGGSSPPNCTSKINNLGPDCFPVNCTWEAPGKDEGPFVRLRQILALPIYLLSLILDFASVALGRLATLVAGDDWPG
jgi:hypothetical protein